MRAKKFGAMAMAMAMAATMMPMSTFAQEEETYDFGGAEVRVFGNKWNDLDPDAEGDKTQYLDAAAQVEEKYNIKFVYAKPDGYDGYNLGELIQAGITAGDAGVDILDSEPDALISLLSSGALTDLTNDMDQIHVGSLYKEAVTWQDHCYGMTFDNVGDTYFMVYSRDYLEEIGMDVTPTEKFMAGEWSYDDMKEYLTEMKAKLPEGSRAACIAGELPENVELSIQAAVSSPGVPTDIPLVNRMRDRGVQILGEIELGFLAEQGRVIAITGTNGKTTTTTLTGEIMKAHFGAEKTFVVGNIGNPYTLEVTKTSKDSVTVGEISSFQLETIHTFHPVVSAILNITPDHLNRHHTMEAYVAAKEAVASHQTKNDICVLNYDNDYTRDFAGRCPATPVLFSSHHELKNGYFLRGDKIIKSVNGEETELMDIHKDMNLVGLCNVENVMAAIAIAEGMQVPMETILTVIRGFHAVEHRIEFVATKGGVDYYNDSKGTNPDAAIQGIKAMSKPTVLIGGGYDKQSEYDEWIDSFDGKVKCLVLIGQTREKIAECARKHGFDKIRFADTYEECLKLCTELAQPGEAVLLSPACASWGMFPNYEVRGQLFKEYVHGLAE